MVFQIGPWELLAVIQGSKESPFRNLRSLMGWAGLVFRIVGNMGRVSYSMWALHSEPQAAAAAVRAPCLGNHGQFFPSATLFSLSCLSEVTPTLGSVLCVFASSPHLGRALQGHDPCPVHPVSFPDTSHPQCLRSQWAEWMITQLFFRPPSSVAKSGDSLWTST